jgi:hypothetical protein
MFLPVALLSRSTSEDARAYIGLDDIIDEHVPTRCKSA